MPWTQNNYFLVIKNSLCLTGCLVIGSLQDKHLLLHLAIVWQQQEISIAHKSDLILTRSQLTLASLLSLLSLFFKVLFSLKHKCSPSTISIASIHRVEFSIWQKSGRSLFLKFLMLTKKRRGKKKKTKQKQKLSTQRAAVEVSLPASFFRGGQASLSLLEFNQNRAHKCQIQGGWEWDGTNLQKVMLFVEMKGFCACGCPQAWSRAFLNMHNNL